MGGAKAVTTDRLIALMRERLDQHRNNLRLWELGALTPTEPDDDERYAVMRELRAAIHELEYLLRYATPSDGSAS
jgi:hypothetical protein